MARTSYQITQEDLIHARFYLGDIRLAPLLKKEDDQTVATKELSKISYGSRKASDAAALQTWSEQYLSAAGWTKLKTAIRKRRQRATHDTTTVTISSKAHSLLQKIAKRDNVTFTEVLEFWLAKAAKSPMRVKP